MWSVLTIIVILIGAYFIFSSGKSEEEKFITILATGDRGQIAFAKSLLDDAGIPYVVKGEGVQDLFGMGRLGASYNFITGPAEIQVHVNYEDEARELLDKIDGAAPPSGSGGEAA